MRVLFLNHGALGPMLGHIRVEASLRVGFESLADVQTRFVNPPPRTIASRAFSYRIPFASSHDLHDLRWHLAESARGRRTIRSEVRSFHPNALHIHSQTLSFLSIQIMRRLPTFISVDTTVRDWHAMSAEARTPGSFTALRPSAQLESRAFGAATGVIAWSEWSRRGVLASNPEAKVHAIHPGIDIDRFRPAAVERSDEAHRIVFVGGRFAEKGGEDLLAALRPRLGTRVHVDVVTRESVPRAEGVRTHALLNDDPALLKLLQGADLLCLPTYRDSYAWVLLEAMACGMPVVSTRVAAIPDIVGPDAGFLVAPGDVTALRAALFTLLDDEPRRREMGRAARRRVEERFDARVSGRRLRELFAQEGLR